MTSVAREGDRRVLITTDISHSDSQPRLVDLSDPQTGQPRQYLLTNTTIHEINWFKQKFSSWFIGDTVVQDGGVYLGTPIDPLFFFLPLVEKSTDMFCDMEHILTCGNTPAISQLTSLLGNQLQCLCDVKENGGQSYYKMNEDKVLRWLKAKVDQAKTALQTSEAAGFDSMDDIALTAYGAGLIAEYISTAWEIKLEKMLNISEETVLPVTNFASENGMDRASSDVKRPRVDPKEAAKVKAAAQREATKKEKLAKEAKGMKSLKSFFGGGKAKS